ncbi:hypothetical protein Hanom_Chr03g00202541 [Helianthus anomalus]
MNMIFLNQLFASIQVASCSISSYLCINSHIKFEITYRNMNLLPSLTSNMLMLDFEFQMVYRKLVNYLSYLVKLRTERISGRLFQVFP